MQVDEATCSKIARLLVRDQLHMLKRHGKRSEILRHHLSVCSTCRRKANALYFGFKLLKCK
jgi:hypothetical protein